MQKKKIVIALIKISALAVSACNLGLLAASPTPRPTPTYTSVPAPANGSGNASCLVGTWQVGDFNNYVQTILNNALSQFGQVGQVSSSGAVHYTFSQDGKLKVVADQLELKTSISISVFPVDAQIEVNGSASADYAVQEGAGVLTISNFDPGDLTIQATANGKTVDQQIDPSLLLFNAGQATTSLPYQCQADTLQLTIHIPELPDQAIQLKRIS